MAGQGPPGGDEPRRWQDRDTEPIPRARFDDEAAPQGRQQFDDSPPSGYEEGSAHGASPTYGEGPPHHGEPGRSDGPGYSEGMAFGRGPGYSPDTAYSEGAAYGGGSTYGEEPPYGEEPGFEEPPARPFDQPPRVPPYGEPERERYVGTVSAGALVADEPYLTEEELAALHRGPAPLVVSRRVLPLEEEPSRVVQRYLFPTEKFRGEWRRHPIQLANEIALAAVATIVMGLLTGYLARFESASSFAVLFVFGWAAVLIWVAWQVADWWYDRFILTNKRVMVVSGIITRNVAMMPLLRVTDMKYVQSPLGRVLRYGTFELESAGQEQALRRIKNLPNPNDLYLRIVEEMYEPEAVEARLAGAVPEGMADDGT